jgi:predicted CopG family antitoxin
MLIDIFEGFLSTGTLKKQRQFELAIFFLSQKQEEVKKQKAEWQERLDVAQKRQKEPWCRMRLDQ